MGFTGGSAQAVPKHGNWTKVGQQCSLKDDTACFSFSFWMSSFDCLRWDLPQATLSKGCMGTQETLEP